MAIKTEHCGAKHGDGAYWGRKVIAKAVSRKLRRANDKREGDSYYGLGMSIKTLWTKQQQESGEEVRLSDRAVKGSAGIVILKVESGPTKGHKTSIRVAPSRYLLRELAD